MGQARAGSLRKPAARAGLKLEIRGRIGREICVRSLRGACTLASCPFVHPEPHAVVLASLSVRHGPLSACTAPLVSLSLSVQTARPLSLVPAGQSGALSLPSEQVADAPLPKSGKQTLPKTFGVVSQYKKIARPEAGVLFIPVDVAASAGVSFSPPTSMIKATSPAVDLESSAHGRLGFETKAGLVTLHHETYDEIAMVRAPAAVHSLVRGMHSHSVAVSPQALAKDAPEVHEWIASECERMQQLPDAFREVWERVEAGDELLAATTNTESLSGHQGSLPIPLREDEGEMELHARLRRQIRHSMHVMMQQANPGSYYADIEHMAPT